MKTLNNIHIASKNHNQDLSDIFSSMADCYNYLGRENRYKANAYSSVAKTLSQMSQPIDIRAGNKIQLKQISGIGEKIADKISEYLKSGKIKAYESLKSQVPLDLLELSHSPGIGPLTIRLLHESLGVETREELTEEIRKGTLQKIKGFGKKKMELLRNALRIQPQEAVRWPFRPANNIARRTKEAFRKIPGIQKITIGGSLRRKEFTIGDIDFVLTARKRNWQRIIDTISQSPLIKKILAKGTTKISFQLKDSGIQVDIRIVEPESYGAALLYFTGNKKFNIHIRQLAKIKNLKINEYGVFNLKTGKQIGGATESEIFSLLQIPFKPPEARNDSQQ